MHCSSPIAGWSRDLYDMLQYKLQQAVVDAGLNSVDTMVVDSARVPLDPVELQEGSHSGIRVATRPGGWSGCCIVEGICFRPDSEHSTSGAGYGAGEFGYNPSSPVADASFARRGDGTSW